MQATTPKTTKKQARNRVGATLISFPLLGFAVGAAAGESVSYGVDVGVGASDNIGLVASNPRSEIIGEAGLDFNVQRVNTRLNVNATGDFAFLDYLHHTYPNQTIGRFDGLASFGVIPERLVWVLQDDFGQAQLDPFAAVSPANLQNINYLQTGPDLTLHLSSAAFLMLSARDSQLEISINRRDGVSVPVRLSLATFTEGYATLLVTDMRPMQWPSIAVDALDSIRTSLEKLNRALGGNADAKGALENISDEVNGLARMIDEMLDVEGSKRSEA